MVYYNGKPSFLMDDLGGFNPRKLAETSIFLWLTIRRRLVCLECVVGWFPVFPTLGLFRAEEVMQSQLTSRKGSRTNDFSMTGIAGKTPSILCIVYMYIYHRRYIDTFMVGICFLVMLIFFLGGGANCAEMSIHNHLVYCDLNSTECSSTKKIYTSRANA